MVELYFRDTGHHSGHAQIAELEIDYTPSLLWHGDEDIAEGKVYMRHVTFLILSPCKFIYLVYNWAGEWDRTSGRYKEDNMFDSDPGTLWHSSNNFATSTKDGFRTSITEYRFTRIVQNLKID